jgi:hypothetical protein
MFVIIEETGSEGLRPSSLTSSIRFRLKLAGSMQDSAELSSMMVVVDGCSLLGVMQVEPGRGKWFSS